MASNFITISVVKFSLIRMKSPAKFEFVHICTSSGLHQISRFFYTPVEKQSLLRRCEFIRFAKTHKFGSIHFVQDSNLCFEFRLFLSTLQLDNRFSALGALLLFWCDCFR